MMSERHSELRPVFLLGMAIIDFRVSFATRIRALAVVTATVAAAGCGGEAEPRAGDATTVASSCNRPDPLRPEVVVRRLEGEWRTRLAERAAQAPAQQFANLPRGELGRRVAEAAEQHAFTVERLEVLRPLGDAPLLAVRTADPKRLAAATPAILKRLDPKERTGDDRTGWVYEGFFFEARDERGVAFLVVHNFWRGPGPGGGQWARSDDLYPFAHSGLQACG